MILLSSNSWVSLVSLQSEWLYLFIIGIVLVLFAIIVSLTKNNNF